MRKQTTVPAALRELIILRVAVLNRATFEFEAHVPYARAAGMTDAKVDAVRHWSAETDATQTVAGEPDSVEQGRALVPRSRTR